MDVVKDRDVVITKKYRNLKVDEGIKAGCCIESVRTSVGVSTFAIAALMILIVVQAVKAGDLPMSGYDLTHCGEFLQCMRHRVASVGYVS